MTITEPGAVVPETEVPEPEMRNGSDRDPVLIVMLALVAVLAAVAILGPIVISADPNATDLLALNEGPSADHPFGTDSLGRDILSRIVNGSRLSLAAPLVVVIGSTIVGAGLAIIATRSGGRLDAVLNRIFNVMFAVPGILVAVLASAVFGAGFWAPVLALTVVYVPYAARIVRSVALRQWRMEYVDGLRLAGIGPVRIGIFHVLPNVLPVILAQATVGYGTALAEFAAISFIGLGVQPPAAEWGLMVAQSRPEILNGNLEQALAAGLAILGTVVLFNTLGDRIRRRSEVG